MISVGSPAPAIDLETQFGTRFRLADHRGKHNVLILGYPLDWTPICSSELPELNRMIDQFRDAADTEVVSLSSDSRHSHLAWSQSMREPLRFPMLADANPHGEVSRALGLWIPSESITDRGTVIIDKNGVVQYAVSVGKENRRNLPDLLREAVRINGGLKPGQVMLAAPEGGGEACSLDNRAGCAVPPAGRIDLPRAPSGRAAGYVSPAGAPETQGPVIFVSRTCGHCMMLKQSLQSLKWQPVATMVDVGTPAGSALVTKRAPTLQNVPALHVPGEDIYVGNPNVLARIKRLIAGR